MKLMTGALVGLALLCPHMARAADQEKADTSNPYDLPQGSAFVHTQGIAAPLYHRGRRTAFIHYTFSLVVIDDDHASAIRTKRPRLQETILDALNRYSFAQRHAPTRIDIPRLKEEILARTQKLFGKDVVLRILVTQARPT